MRHTGLAAAVVVALLFVPPPLAGGSLAVLRVPEDFSTIQEAVGAASPGDIIRVARGTYSERVVIDKPNLRLQGAQAVLDGSGVGGTGIGIHVFGAEGVVISGFTVQSFERGIVLEGATFCRVLQNEVRNNTDKDLSTPPFLSDGIVLIGAHGNEVLENRVHDNGHNGIFLIAGSTGNTIRANRTNDNGAQTGAALAGCGVQLTGGSNNGNRITENEVLGNGWGILLGPSGAMTDNFVGQNRIHQNHRAGVAIFQAATGNFVQQNDARGNGVGNLSPSFRFDLFDQGDVDNVWLRNQGTTNF